MDLLLDPSDVSLDVLLDLLLGPSSLDPSDVWLDLLLDPLVRSKRSVLDFVGGETTCGMPVILFEILITLSISVLSFDLASVEFHVRMDWATVKVGGCTLLHKCVPAVILRCCSLSIGLLLGHCK